MNVHPDLRIWVLNMHDVFLNASLQREGMKASPMPDDPQTFDVSNRGRYERAWVRDLYVLVEAWQSQDGLRAELGRWVDITEIGQLIGDGEAKGHLAHMADTRHYMSHRDRREYWDRGRLAVMQPGALAYHETLTLAFSKTLLLALRTLPRSSAPTVEASSDTAPLA